MPGEAGRRGKWRRRALRAIAWSAGLALLALLLLLATLPWSIRAVGGASPWRAVTQRAQLSPAELSPAELSPGARALLNEVLSGLDARRAVDFHTHLAGIGDGSDCWVNPRMLSWWHPKEHVRFRIYLSAAGLGQGALGAGVGLDKRYVDRLLELVEAEPLPLRHLLLAFDHRYDAQGRVDLEHSEFHVPNESMWAAVQRAPERFLPCVSIHPYRADAVAELGRWAERGVRFVKWLPNAMGIDPASERCDPFYARMAAAGIALLTHTGREEAVEASADQELGNPLRLRRALAHGVRVIAAHCASSGDAQDLDHPGQRTSNFELFLRLMDDPAYDGLLYGEISAVTQVNRFGTALEALLERPDLHHRLVNGSDWPLPAINVLFSTRALERAGFLTEAERVHLNELYDYHPLLFDLALKRVVHAPRSGRRFLASAFLAPEELLPPPSGPEAQGE